MPVAPTPVLTTENVSGHRVSWGAKSPPVENHCSMDVIICLLTPLACGHPVTAIPRTIAPPPPTKDWGMIPSTPGLRFGVPVTVLSYQQCYSSLQVSSWKALGLLVLSRPQPPHPAFCSNGRFLGGFYFLRCLSTLSRHQTGPPWQLLAKSHGSLACLTQMAFLEFLK